MNDLELSVELTDRLDKSFKKIFRKLITERCIPCNASIAVFDQMLANFSIRILLGTSRVYGLEKEDLQKRIDVICKALNMAVKIKGALENE